MKKITILLIIHLIPILVGCPCPSNGTFTKIEIASVESIIFGYNKLNREPEFDNISRHFVGLRIAADSIIETIVQDNNAIPFFPPLYACSDKTTIEYIDHIDSIKVFTVFDYNDQFQAGEELSSIIRLKENFRGFLREFNLETHQFERAYFEFTRAPTSDSLQLRITGRISNGTQLDMTTNMIHFSD